MPEENPSPGPGHFMPGGAGDALTDSDRGTPPLTANRRQTVGLGKARALSTPDPTLQRKARPIADDPNASGVYSGPPVAPLAGGPLPPLSGSRRTGGPRPVGWNTNASRTGAQYSAAPPPVKPPRQHSRAIIAGLSVLVLVILSGATYAGLRLVNSYDNTYDKPLSRPEIKKSQTPIPTPPNPTVTVTATPVPDLVRLQKNEIYKVGKIPTVNCKEPIIKPSNQSTMLRYYQALLPCLNKTWQPLVEKAGYPFRAPKLQLAVKGGSSSCLGVTDLSYYCGVDETISMQWQDELKLFRQNPAAAKVFMMDTVAHEYGHHVQMLTNILISSESREGWTKSNAMKLEWNRRKELQASCLGSAFLSANKSTLGFRGDRLSLWEYMQKHSGDEYNPKKIRDHGSRKNTWYWTNAAFKTANPASCNTYVAPPAKVS